MTGTESAIPEEDVPDATAVAVAEDVEEAHVAKIYGERLIQLPLDLLLYLIRKQNLDVLDIAMAPLTRQYLEYVDAARAKNLELAADYLVMAAMLIEIKSRMLLPRPPSVAGEEEDPRAELVRRLLEYEQMKKAAQKLDELPQLGRDVMAVTVWIERTVVDQLNQTTIAAHGTTMHKVPTRSTSARARTDMR